MDYSRYQLARVQVTDGVASVVINNPPINIFDLPLYGEMAKLAGELEGCWFPWQATVIYGLLRNHNSLPPSE